MKKGFTLIELLAVIVILAIIALIATPIVLSIINDAKNSATIRNAEFYISALQNEIALESVKQGGIFSPKLCEVKKINNVVGIYCDNKLMNINVDAEKPLEYSKITFEEGKVKNVNLKYPNGTISINNKNELVFEDIPKPNSFAEDSWETIAANVRVGNLTKYKVGDTEKITLTSENYYIAGTYTVRIANISTPEECLTEGFSQTACGFVVEFAEIISYHGMNSTATNAGGWEKSKMRNYLSNDMINSFPEELKTNIIDTYVVSSHESDKLKCYETTDKLYLLSPKEVWGKMSTVEYDLGEVKTRQLDYYNQKGVTKTNCSGAIKSETSDYWLRSALFNNLTNFYAVNKNGCGGTLYATSDIGVSIAFRL